jgi:hypothetical protein
VPIRAEWNVLVNPLHLRIGELQIDPSQPFVFDARMFQQTQPKAKGAATLTTTRNIPISK